MTVPLGSLLVPGLLVVLGFALVVVGGSAWARAKTGAEEAGGPDGIHLGLVGHLFLLFVATQPALAVPPWPLLGILLVLDLALAAAAFATGVGALLAVALVLSQVVLLVLVGGGPGGAVADGGRRLGARRRRPRPPRAGPRAARRRRGARRSASAVAQGAAAALLLGQARRRSSAGVRDGRPGLALLVAAHLLLAGALLVVATLEGWHGLPVVSVGPLVPRRPPLGRLGRRRGRTAPFPASSSPGLLWLLFLALPPLAARRAPAARAPWVAAVLASAAFFFLGRASFAEAGWDGFVGVLPVGIAAALALLLVALLRVEAPAARDLGRLALVAGAALAFVTVAIPLQLDKEWITIGWALEAAALAWLFTRIPHRGLLLASAGLSAVVFARLVLNEAVLSYHARSATPILNWYLYTYLVAAAALFLAARFLRGTADELAGGRLRASSVQVTLGTVLLFALVNIEIADWFATGPTVTFSLARRDLARAGPRLHARLGRLRRRAPRRRHRGKEPRRADRGARPPRRDGPEGVPPRPRRASAASTASPRSSASRSPSPSSPSRSRSSSSRPGRRNDAAPPPRPPRAPRRRPPRRGGGGRPPRRRAAFRFTRAVTPGARRPEPPRRRRAAPRGLRAPARGAALLSDLRLVAADGREVPYLLVAPPRKEPEWVRASLLPIPATKSASGFEADLGALRRIDRLRVAGLPAPFLKRLRLEGSGDRARWTVLVGRGNPLRPSRGGARPDRGRLPRGRAPLPAARLERRAERPRAASAAGRGPPRRHRAAAPEPLREAVPFERRASEPGRSRFRLKLPAAGLPIAAIEVGVASGNVLRDARVLESRLSGGRLVPFELGAATLRRAERDDAAAAEMTIRLALPRPRPSWSSSSRTPGTRPSTSRPSRRSSRGSLDLLREPRRGAARRRASARPGSPAPATTSRRCARPSTRGAGPAPASATWGDRQPGGRRRGPGADGRRRSLGGGARPRRLPRLAPDPARPGRPDRPPPRRRGPRRRAPASPTCGSPRPTAGRCRTSSRRSASRSS